MDHSGYIGSHGVQKPWYFNRLIQSPSVDSWKDRWHHHSCYWQPVVRTGGAIIVLCHGENMEASNNPNLKTGEAVKFKMYCKSTYCLVHVASADCLLSFSSSLLDFSMPPFLPDPICELLLSEYFWCLASRRAPAWLSPSSCSHSCSDRPSEMLLKTPHIHYFGPAVKEALQKGKKAKK